MAGRGLLQALVVSFAALLLVSLPGATAEYYVRTDGGSAEQCTGLADAPYPGAGTGQACAWDHPFRALPPDGEILIEGGDTLLIGGGSYRMGWNAPGASSDGERCASDYRWGCIMAPIPSGPDPGHPTRILGSGWDTGCASPPELWGAERADLVLNLTDASNVEVGCLEISDRSGCVEGHSGGLECERDTAPYGDWAVVGVHAEDSSSVFLHDLDIHGLAATGIHAGRLTDWRLERVRIAGNGLAGWDGDLWDDGGDSNSGLLHFREVTVEWNGCAETWPEGEPSGCWGQTAGGYGDGLGTGATLGDWVFEDCAFLHNTSDGLDLLYARVGSTIAIRRTIAEGNAGNQIKTNGPAVIESSIVVGNCGFFDGQSFTYDVDNCRATGNALSLDLRADDQVVLFNNTIASEGDCLILGSCDTEQSTCTGSERITLRNNILVGYTDFLQPDDLSCLAYQETFDQGDAVFDFGYSLISGVKDDACPGTHATCGVAPGLADETLADFDAHLESDSPAIDAGTAEGAPGFDFDDLPRDAQPDLGAYEYREPGTCTLTCSVNVPATAEVGAPVAFSGTVTATGCSGSPSWDWDFGDGSAHSTLEDPSHTYQTAGTYSWAMEVAVDAATCSASGQITVGGGPQLVEHYLVPGVAHLPGEGDTTWRSDLAVVNPSTSSAELVVTLYDHDTGASTEVARTLAAGATEEWADVLVSVLGLADAAEVKGILHIAASVPLAISCRTFNQETATRTYGQQLPALTEADALTGGDEGIVPHLKKGSGFRTNLGVVNLGDSEATVTVSLFGANGEQIGSTSSLTVTAGRWQQQNDVFAWAGAGDQEIAYARVEASPQGASVWVYASLVDNATGDPTTIAVVVPEE